MGSSVKTYILATPKNWHDILFESLSKRRDQGWIRVTSEEGFSGDNLKKIQPDKIFIPHWSHIIPAEIYNSWDCIVFHMTDLPFGRGGSPLQNLIVRGFKETKISAIKVTKGVDTGDVYLKKDLSLEGTATEIFERSVPIVEEMIQEIIEKDLQPKQQVGEPLVFSRRKPNESNVISLNDLSKLYDHIRMLDCEGYPNAFLETEHFKIEFTAATLDCNNQLIKARVNITKK